MERKKPKQDRRPELGLCNVAEGGADYASGAFGSRVTPLLHVCVWIVGPAVSGSKEPMSAA